MGRRDGRWRCSNHARPWSISVWTSQCARPTQTALALYAAATAAVVDSVPELLLLVMLLVVEVVLLLLRGRRSLCWSTGVAGLSRLSRTDGDGRRLAQALGGARALLRRAVRRWLWSPMLLLLLLQWRWRSVLLLLLARRVSGSVVGGGTARGAERGRIIAHVLVGRRA